MTWPRWRLLPAVVAIFLVVVPAASARGIAAGHAEHVCGKVSGHVAACTALVRSDANLQPLATSTYQSGYAPADLLSAYNLGGAAINQGGTQTVAIIDAYDAPNLESDLGTYRQQFGLTPCTTSNLCFRKVNQNGGTTPPAADASWAQETSLDVEMVSAICPNCHILVVEANSATYADLAAAVDEAAALGATQISNSYGGSEAGGSPYESHYNHPGIDITVSSGDSGYGVEFPASSPHVTAVGGTHLVKDSSARGWGETVWSGAGSGCSGVFPKPAYQGGSSCSRRTVADQSAVADPNTGVAVYDSYPYQGAAGWFVFGGTSVSSPIIASVDALAGGRSPGTSYGAFPYNNPSLFNDVTSGTNGSCGGTYLCTAAVGYDGPTGMGTPNGAGAGVPPTPPSNITAPSISGNAVQGSTLTATQGTWNGNPTTFIYTWTSCNGTCVTVGTNSATYKLQASDVGATITVTVQASNTTGNASSTSNPVGPVQALAADFTISLSPSIRSVKRGYSTSYTVTVVRNATFSGAVNLTAAGPANVRLTLSATSITSTATLTVRPSSLAQTGTFPISVTGSGSGVTHTATASLTVR